MEAPKVMFLDTEKYSVDNLPDTFFNDIRKLPMVKRNRGNQGGKTKAGYVDLISAFDIETTRLHDYTQDELKAAINAGAPLIDNTVMYIWQWCFTWNISNNKNLPVFREVCVYGRTWEEYQQFCNDLTRTLRGKDRIVVFDHYLAYEFQFLRGVRYFGNDAVFNIKPRQPLKAVSGNLEFRCSYKLSNMSLGKFAESMKTPHQKLELDYDKKRYWYTPLTTAELDYALNDVICLCECIVKKNIYEGDNLYTMPLTSTGYVRREVREAVLDNRAVHKSITKMMPDYSIYKELKEAFRGGNTHANRYFAGELLKGVIHSADRSSSYPAVICNAKYPMQEFQPIHFDTLDDLKEHLKRWDDALLCRVTLYDVRLKDISWGCPYISVSKCRATEGVALDNGRVLCADKLELTVTDVDLAIIFDEYDFDDIDVEDAYVARYGKIPQPIIDKVIEYYQKKTSLKGVEGYEYFYMKNKSLLNSIYGMMVQDLVKVLILYVDGGIEGVIGHFEEDTSKSEEEIFEKTASKGFLNYAWGVWVTAWARYELERGIRLVHNTPGAKFLYCDTDSTKYMGNVDWTAYNEEKIAESMKSGSHATDPKGKEHYMGVFEAEHDMDEFITMGAKKYAYHLTEPDKSGQSYFITVAGVGKASGVKELQEEAERKGIADPLELFKEGFIFKGQAGGLEAVYNDMALCGKIMEVNDDGVPVEVVSNVTLRPSTYTLGYTDEYRELISGCHYECIDDLMG